MAFALNDIVNHRWLFMDLNSYFASVEQQENPDLRGKPVAVVPLQTDATCAIAASYEAKAYGIKTGTKIYEAKRLCPNLICVLADHQKYVEYHHAVLTAMDKHLPVESIESIDEAACRLTYNQREEANALAIARAMKAQIHEDVGEHMYCSIGIAPNKYLAKIATELQKPDGLVMLHKEDMHEQMIRLKLQDFTGIGLNMLKRLHKHGIFTTEQLLKADTGHLRRVWGGVQGERMWYKLRGAELPPLETTKRTVGHSHMLAPEWRPPERAHTVMQRLTLKAASRLRRMEYYCTAMDISLRLEKGPRLVTDLRFRPCCDSPTLMMMMEQGWQQLLPHIDRQRVKKTSVSLRGLQPKDALHADMFESTNVRHQRTKYERVSGALDVLNQKFGRDTAVMGFLPKQSHTFSGTKIAFSRVPERAEFWE